MYSVDEVAETLQLTAPDALDAFEVAAFLESLGVTDGISMRMGYNDVFHLAAHLYDTEYKERILEPASAPEKQSGSEFLKEAKCLLRKITTGLGYSLPWILLTAVETLSPYALDVPAALGSALTLALIASLVTTGGFVQVITRDTSFMLGMREPFLARRSAAHLLRLGLASTIVFAVVACFGSLYFHFFGARELALAAMYYVLFSVLWMTCAALCAQGLGLAIPMILLGTGIAAFEAHVIWKLPTVGTLLVWPLLAVATALTTFAWQARRLCQRQVAKAVSTGPGEAVHLYSLLPVFFYGTAYFSFLFLDRLCAGSSVPWNSGLSFGVDPVYKHAMDLSLFSFLLTAIVVEYLTDVFLRRWWSRISRTEAGRAALVTRHLRGRYCGLLAVVAVTFATCLAATYYYAIPAMHLAPSPQLRNIIVLGGAGYLVLSTCLFANIVLISVDAIRDATKGATLGIAANFLVGYTLSHSLSMQFAAAGLLAGSCLFAWHVHRSVWRLLAHPDYQFSLV